MPQLDFYSYIYQFRWGIGGFFFVFLVLINYVFPKAYLCSSLLWGLLGLYLVYKGYIYDLRVCSRESVNKYTHTLFVKQFSVNRAHAWLKIA